MRRLCSGLQLDGVDDYVDVGNPSSLNFGTGDFSLEAWVKPGTQSGARGTVLGKGERWRIDVEAPSCIDADFSVTLPGGSTVQRPFWACGTSVFDGNWHHIVVTYDRDGNGTIYVDGAMASGANNNISIADLAAGSVDSNWQVRLGHRTLNEAGTATQWPYNGLLDEVRIYNRALSATEVAARYQAQPEDTDTLHYYLGGKEVAFKRGGTLYYPLQEHLGSTSVVTNSSGAVVEFTAYYPYGATRTGAIATTEEKFTGQRLDSTGLYYYGARYYDPNIGRFVSPDTIVQNYRKPASFNRYAYAFDNPLKYSDPSGHVNVSDWGGGLPLAERPSPLEQAQIETAKMAARAAVPLARFEAVRTGTLAWQPANSAAMVDLPASEIPPRVKVIQVSENSVTGLYMKTFLKTHTFTIDETIITTRDITSDDPNRGFTPQLGLHETQHAMEQAEHGSDEFLDDYLPWHFATGHDNNPWEKRADDFANTFLPLVRPLIVVDERPPPANEILDPWWDYY